MRTKLFLAFIFIISLGLLSNVVFEKMIIGDFNDFLSGNAEDHIYWVMASVEESHSESGWDTKQLADSLHWGLMLGFETYIEDNSGKSIMSSTEVLLSMDQNMRSRMSSLLQLPEGTGDFTWYPLYFEGEEIGKLYARPLERLGMVPLNEEVFRRRGREFLIISFLIAGGGALALSLLFIVFLSKPLRRLTAAAERIAKGDFYSGEKIPQKKFKDEIDRLTDTFNYMSEALRREDTLRKHLTSNIAHELRTPLTIIRGNLEAIEDGIMSDPGKVIENVKTEIKRIVSLVEGIEDLTRAEASFFQKGNVEEIDIKEFAESVAGGMSKIFSEKGLYLKTTGPSMKVMTYPEKLHIVLKNLLANALKFTEKGGITVKWDREKKEMKEGFYISVTDTGKGIADSHMLKIFDRFYKDASSGGKGLGLAIVKELVEIMGGSVEVESKMGMGTKFMVKF